MNVCDITDVQTGAVDCKRVKLGVIEQAVQLSDVKKGYEYYYIKTF